MDGPAGAGFSRRIDDMQNKYRGLDVLTTSIKRIVSPVREFRIGSEGITIEGAPGR